MAERDNQKNAAWQVDAYATGCLKKASGGFLGLGPVPDECNFKPGTYLGSFMVSHPASNVAGPEIVNELEGMAKSCNRSTLFTCSVCKKCITRDNLRIK